jgi:hypothetical protein
LYYGAARRTTIHLHERARLRRRMRKAAAVSSTRLAPAADVHNLR